jgi:hypothetical protein
MRTSKTNAALAFAVCVAGLTPVAASGEEPKAPPKPWYEKVTVKGYLQLDAVFPQGNAVTGSYSNLRIRRARPTISAQLDPLTRAQIQVDAGSGKPGSGASTVVVTDTFAERTFPGFGLVRFGQYLVPFGSEVYEDNAALRLPMELSHACESVALSERDIGLTVQSSVNPADPTHWAVSFVNGQGFKSADSNPNKTWIGRVAHDITPAIRVGVSGILGTYRAADDRNHDRHVLAGELHIKPCAWAKLTGEFYNARFVDSTTSRTPKDVRFNGGYVMLEGNLASAQSVPFVRYQRTYGGLSYRSLDFGWRYQYTPTQRLTLEYDFVQGHQRDSFGARWQVGF